MKVSTLQLALLAAESGRLTVLQEAVLFLRQVAPHTNQLRLGYELNVDAVVPNVHPSVLVAIVAHYTSLNLFFGALAVRHVNDSFGQLANELLGWLEELRRHSLATALNRPSLVLSRRFATGRCLAFLDGKENLFLLGNGLSRLPRPLSLCGNDCVGTRGASCR